MINGRRPVSPREWIGDQPYPWPAATGLDAGALLVACYSLSAVQLLRTRQDKPYLRLQLTDAHGNLEGRVWEETERFTEWLEAGQFIGVRGRIEIFNNERQLRVEDVVPVQVTTDDLRLFLPRSPRDPATMERELRALVSSVRDAPFRGLLRILLGPDTASGVAFRRAPAAKQNHHAYVSGLLEHTISVTQIVDALARHYGSTVDRDLLISGALLHDIGKIREIEAAPGFPYTDEGKLLGHILLGLELIEEAARVVPVPHERLLLLRHLVASHQGRYEWQSPREPRILEALLLHYADDLDAKMHQAARAVGRVRDGWSPWERGMGDFLRHLPAPESLAPPQEPDEADEEEHPPLDLFHDL